MFYGSRKECLELLRLVGATQCCYAGPWPDNLCDCKYGVEGVEGLGRKVMPQHSILTEHTGCPELRSIYRVIESMSNEEWEDLTRREKPDPELFSNHD